MRGIGLGLASICAGFASITFAFIFSIRSIVDQEQSQNLASDTTAVTASFG
jgi:hypothetical protein